MRISKPQRCIVILVGMIQPSHGAFVDNIKIKRAAVPLFRRRNMAHFNHFHLMPRHYTLSVAYCTSSSYSTVTSNEETDHPSSTCGVILPEDKSYHEIAHQVASKLNLILLDQSHSSSSSSSTVVSNSHMTHSLHILPYSFKDLRTYALAIRPYMSNTNPKKIRTNHKEMMQPIFVDFCPNTQSRMGKRIYRDLKTHPAELLLKAIYTKKIRKQTSIPSSSSPIIFDLTAGWAQDTLLMIQGDTHSHVHMVERHPIVAELLQDALRRIQFIASQDISSFTSSISDEDDDTDTSSILYARNIESRLFLHKMNAISFIHNVKKHQQSSTSSPSLKPNMDKPDICYLDPMFPPRTKSSAVKKNMQILHGLLQPSTTIPIEDSTNIHHHHRLLEEQSLLENALSITKSHVVVKRPIHAEPLGGKSYSTLPSYSLDGSINRFDIYL